MIFGLLDFSPWQVVVAVLIMTHLTIAAVTIFLHRAQAHRALELHPLVAHPTRFWLWLTTGMVTREWVAVHRKHHVKCETPADPHSPRVVGLGQVLSRGVELYRAAADDPELVARYGKGTPEDWIERHLYSRYPLYGVGLMLILDLALFGVYGVTAWAVQMLWIPIFAAGVINGIGHYWGYRNFETHDASTNIVPWGLLIGGEELHNNHHAFPASARLSSRWWELDLGWFYIQVLALFRLARVERVAPQTKMAPGKVSVDMDTLRAVLIGRMYVIARYSKEVLKPVARQELCRTEHLCRRKARAVSRLMARERDRLDSAAKLRLEQILRDSRQLTVVYQYREQLRQIWERNAPSQEELLRALQDWCQRAEASGIAALEGFSRNLRGLTLAPPA